MMRLTKQEVYHIKKTINEIDCDALIYLFGSRANPHAKGGDIDLLVISQALSNRDIRKIKIQLYDLLGYQKIDIILAKSVDESAIVKIAIKDGVKL